jgi:major membrane immunogen (membrane-anchored lipoprotein)
MPSKILITPKPLLIAVRDMDKVIDMGKVKMDVNERAGRYRNISLEHEDTRKSVWKGLIELCAKDVKKVRVDEEVDNEEGGVSIDDALMKLLG